MLEFLAAGYAGPGLNRNFQFIDLDQQKHVSISKSVRVICHEWKNLRRLEMSDKIKSEMMSRRRVFSLLGLAAALGFAVPTTVLTVSDAEAQTAGMERRQDRRAGRTERRQERRTGRTERRQQRRQ
jgi:hypothetical protein